MEITVNDIDALHVLAVLESISDADAMATVQEVMPNRKISIERLRSGRVRIWADEQKLTVRPTLREAVARVRWFYCCSFYRPCPLQPPDAKRIAWPHRARRKAERDND